MGSTSSGNVTSLIDFFAETEINELKYQKVKDWFNRLNQMIKLDYPLVDEIEDISELKATRDILVHNSGIVNQIYINKSGNRSKFKLGETIEVENQYFLVSYGLLKKVIETISIKIIQKLS